MKRDRIDLESLGKAIGVQQIFFSKGKEALVQKLVRTAFNLSNVRVQHTEQEIERDTTSSSVPVTSQLAPRKPAHVPLNTPIATEVSPTRWVRCPLCNVYVLILLFI